MPPFTAMGLARLIAAPVAQGVAEDLQALAGQGFAAIQLAATLELLLAEREPAGRDWTRSWTW